MFEIAQLLTSKTVRVQLPGSTKAEVLKHLLELLEDDPRIGDFERVREAVLVREALMSTGVGKGLALPHARTSAVDEIVAAFATSAHPVPFDAIDGEPVQLYFLLVGPENARSEHIKTMSRVSRLMNEAAFREQLLAAKSAAAIIALFEESERNLG
ncbi:MAG: PTS sugar transporter subunit IIA [Rhodothermales bacterium]|nr:PTS sugar transporter subunit IIA [Rhodothermales bacterium]